MPSIIQINESRWKELRSHYDPILGIGSPIPRFKLPLNDFIEVNLPAEMAGLDAVKFIQKCGSLERSAKKLGIDIKDAISNFTRMRAKFDFEFWAASCVQIQTKVAGIQKFILNRPQRKLLKEMEQMRLAGIPIRIILLKSRQWGGSTFVQLYMGWIQLFWKTSWNSMIVAAKKDQSLHIRGMYHRMASRHPSGIVEGIDKITLSPYEGTQNIRKVDGRDNIIGVGSVEEPDSIRSYTTHMLHLSEVGLWKSTPKVNAESLISNLEGGLVTAPYTLLVKESTAKGVGNYFHKEWQLAEKGKINDRPVFVGWFENPDDYFFEIKDKPAFVASMTEYDKFLWSAGATLEHIAWYREKAKSYHNQWEMQAEFPTNPTEAFQSTGSRVFPIQYVTRTRQNCVAPIAIGDLHADSQKGAGAIKNIVFEEKPQGYISIWTYPHKFGMEKSGKRYTNRYCAFADVGGRSERADYSNVTILDRFMTMYGGTPQVCAEFHGHMDHDLFAWYAARLCMWYGKAHLAVEVNSLQKDAGDAIRGYESDHSLTVLDEIKDYYDNLYYRIKPETIQERWNGVLGFNTNRSTKPMIIDALTGAMRDESYEERNVLACDEFDTYELKTDGSMGAVEGKHDDRVISRAGAIWLSGQMDAVKEVDIVKPAVLSKKGAYAVFA